MTSIWPVVALFAGQTALILAVVWYLKYGLEKSMKSLEDRLTEIEKRLDRLETNYIEDLKQERDRYRDKAEAHSAAPPEQ